MSKFNIAYVPIGVPTFNQELALIELNSSVELLKSLTEDVSYPTEVLTTVDKLLAFLDTLDNPQLLIVQNTTFANAEYITQVLKRFECPVLLWTLREPIIDGGRLRLNSLTGAYSAANALMHFRGKNFEYIFGSAKEEEVINKVSATIKAAKVKFELKSLKITAIGQTPQGFGFGRALDVDMAKVFGATLEAIEARELIDVAKSYTDEECAEYFEKFTNMCCGYEQTAEKNLKDFSRLLKAYTEYVTKNKIGAIASRCWPDFFTSFGTPVCTVLSMLNDLGVSASCEADTYGALSMFIGAKLTGLTTFFGDPVSLDEGENTITFWHCGMASCKLANSEKANVGVHPNRRLGPVMDFGCKPSEKATIFRIGQDGDGKFRIFVTSGSILDKPKQFEGTSIVVKTDGNSKDIVVNSVCDGWEPHFVVAYDDIVSEIEILGKMLEIPVIHY